MKRLIRLITFITALSLIIISCNMPSQPGAAGGNEEEQSDITETPTLQTIDLAGPVMEVGSTYRYVDGTLLVAVPGGTFIMGGGNADNPIHEVSLSDFWVYSTKVTNAQYAGCVVAGNCVAPDPNNNPIYQDYKYINYPVTGVTHSQATAYCEYVHGRLPTEAEWEKTARGPDGNIFPWGDAAPACDLLNFEFCIGNTTNVTDYKNGISYYSALDMTGNVREWVADWYDVNYYNSSVGEDPLGPEFGEKRSVRGSSYQDGEDAVLPSNRLSLDPSLTLPDLGFRCVVEDPTYFASACEILAYSGINLDGSQSDCVPEVVCNDVSITQNALCTNRRVPYTIVTFNLNNAPPDDWAFNAPGCNPVPGEDNKFECNPGEVGPLNVTGACVEVNSCVSSCPTGYTKDGDKCIWDGGSSLGTACLPGSTYDPLTQCCSATVGSTVEVPLCPVGTYLFNGACINVPNAVIDTVNENVIFNSCELPKDQPGDDSGGDVVCVPTTCPIRGWSFNTETCSCEPNTQPPVIP